MRAVLDEVSSTRTKPNSIRSVLEASNSFKSMSAKFDIKTKKSEIASFCYSFLEACRIQHISVLSWVSSEYPALLRKTEDYPLFLFCKGDTSVLSTTAVGVVGTRKITAYGQTVTKKIVSELADEGITTVSGCMYGVDELVHRVSLEKEIPTVAVLGYGHGVAYPARMSVLLEKIITTGGAVVSEYFPGTQPLPGYFLARNRIIAGLSQAVVVTEAAVRSGSHETAVCAAACSRAVFAVPGPITNPYSEGTKWLVNQGATLVSSGYEVSEYLGYKKNEENTSTQPSEKQKKSSEDRTTVSPKDQLLSALAEAPCSVESLAEATRQPLASVIKNLLELELEGRLVKDGILWYLHR